MRVSERERERDLERKENEKNSDKVHAHEFMFIKNVVDFGFYCCYKSFLFCEILYVYVVYVSWH